MTREFSSRLAFRVAVLSFHQCGGKSFGVIVNWHLRDRGTARVRERKGESRKERGRERTGEGQRRTQKCVYVGLFLRYYSLNSSWRYLF